MVTQVSKTKPAVKKILASTVGRDWRGWVIYVEQINPSWSRQLSPDAREPLVYRATADGKLLGQIARAPYAVTVDGPSPGEVVVVKQTGSGPRWHTGPATIHVPRLDAAQLDVARDALLASNKREYRELLKDFGPYAGLADAILEAQSKTLAAVTRGQRSRQLDREIAEFLRGRS